MLSVFGLTYEQLMCHGKIVIKQYDFLLMMRRNSDDSVSQLHDLSEQFSSNRDHTFHSSHKPGKSSGIFVPGAPQCMCMRVGLSIQSAVWCFPNRIIHSGAVVSAQGRIAQYQR